MNIEELRALPLIDAPLTVFDTETTGVNPQEARIVEFGMTQNGVSDVGILFNPVIPPEDWREAQEVCSWTEDEMAKVYNSWTFAEDGKRINELLSNQLVVGYNILDYDIPLINAEQRRAGLSETQFPLVIDVLVIVRRFLRHYRERTLKAVCAMLGYKGIFHRAVDDCRAALFLLKHAIRAGWLPATVGEACDRIIEWKAQQDADWALYTYWLYRDQLKPGNQLMMGAGKECGMPLHQVPIRKLDWYLASDIKFPDAVRAAFVEQLDIRR